MVTFGNDYRKYAKFNILTPVCTKIQDGDYFLEVVGTKLWTKENCQFRIDFVYECTLRLQEFDFSNEDLIGFNAFLLNNLSTLLIENVTKLSTAKVINSNDLPPKFVTLIGDQDMIKILERRWNECVVCVKNNAPLSAIVMMGGLLESLLLSKFLSFPDKNKILAARNCPKDKSTNKPLNFKEWAIKNYIDVAHELGWISQTEKDLGEVLRDYRNYIHPFKEKSHGIILEAKDAMILWEVTKSISRQITNISIP